MTEQIAHITITPRADDYHACVTGMPAVWACGPTRREAIGALVESHPEWFTAPRSDHVAEQSTQDREVAQLISEGYEVVGRDERKVTLRKVKQGAGRYSVSVVDVLADVVFRHRGQVFEGVVPEELR